MQKPVIDFLCKSMDWFLYDRDLCHERANLFPFTTHSYRNQSFAFHYKLIDWFLFKSNFYLNWISKVTITTGDLKQSLPV